MNKGVLKKRIREAPIDWYVSIEECPHLNYDALDKILDLVKQELLSEKCDNPNCPYYSKIKKWFGGVTPYSPLVVKTRQTMKLKKSLNPLKLSGTDANLKITRRNGKSRRGGE